MIIRKESYFMSLIKMPLYNTIINDNSNNKKELKNINNNITTLNNHEIIDIYKLFQQ